MRLGRRVLPVRALEPGEQRQRGLGLGGALPRADGVAVEAARLVGITERDRGRQEAAIGADGGLEMSGGDGRGAPGQLQAPQLVVADRQPRGLGRPVRRRRDLQQTLLQRDGLVPVALVDGQIAQRTQRLGVVGPALQHVAVERARLVEPAGPPSLAGPAHRVPGLRIVVRHLQGRPPSQSLGELTPEREQRAERGIHGRR